MRNKKAKALRKEALRRTVGKPMTAYRRMVLAGIEGGLILNTTCTRAVYHRLKKAA